MVQLFSAYKCNNNSDPELVSINQWYNTKSGVYAYTSNLTGNFGSYLVNHGEAFKTYNYRCLRCDWINTKILNKVWLHGYL